MLVEGSLFRQVYDTVSQERAESEDKSILLFVANSDVAAVCAVRQFQVGGADLMDTCHWLRLSL